MGFKHFLFFYWSDFVKDLSVIRKIAEESHDDWGFKYHILPVVKNAVLLAKKLNADIEIVEVAAYFHDLGISKRIMGETYLKENDHHIVGAQEARKILNELNYSKDFIDSVAGCILSHRGRKGPEPITLEQKIIANADAMAHFDTFLDLFTFFVKKTTNSFEEAVEEIYKKMKRDWEIKLTLPEAKELVKPKYDAIMLLLENMRSYF